MSDHISAIQNTVPLLDQLVRFDTTSYRSNLQLIDFVGQYLSDLGASVRQTFDDTRQKANLFATFGPGHKPGIVLSGHTDVVPVIGQDWHFDPFQATVSGDRIYGRGTADMKGFLALCLAAAPQIADSNLHTPIHMAFSYDEEVGCIGVRGLIQDLGALPVMPKLCVIGEPTCMKIIIAHKGKKNVRCCVHGKESHSALNHQGVNAIDYAALMIGYLRTMQSHIHTHGPFDHAFTPPHTTIHTGLVSGGTALNIVPKSCEFEFEIRNLPNHDVDGLMAEVRGYAQDLVPEMLDVDPCAGFTFDEYNTTPGLNTHADDEAVTLIRRLTGNQDTHKVSFTTEAGLFHQAGISTVVCGPGNIEQAHRPDEYIELSQLTAGYQLIEKLIRFATVT